ncbi:RING finger protein 145-like isoform X2 [Cylas formicarius]|uniref:RING finger protein 145-like isoform X2 n=1 Tax=Cylas formicarius TaxID=197179 RepID=UPI0029584E51|nr:RING finger protein 145-like isoform X2 [Cylas formicarius]
MICFFILCDLALDHQHQLERKTERNIITALTTVLFYSVIGYFATKIRDVCQRSRSRLVSGPLSIMNSLKWLCKIILEWAKAAVVVLCLKEQGIRFEPKILYTVITFTYYLCTEKIFLEIIPSVVEMCEVEKFENLEHLYVPLLMNFVVIVLGAMVEIYSFFTNYSNFLLLSAYFMVYLRIKDAYYNYWECIMAERETFASFQMATRADIEEWDDICAVCLNSMSRAKITPCRHLFHPYCLKQCLKTSFDCPLCKRNFLESRTMLK